MRKSSDKRPAAIKSSRAAQWGGVHTAGFENQVFSPYISGRGRVWDSSYMATRATTPLGRAIFQAVVKESPLPAASTTPSAPRPPRPGQNPFFRVFLRRVDHPVGQAQAFWPRPGGKRPCQWRWSGPRRRAGRRPGYTGPPARPQSPPGCPPGEAGTTGPQNSRWKGCPQ